jgi:glycerol kinase
VQWLRDGLGLIKRSEEIETLAQRVPDSGGVIFVPALVGLGAPHWCSDARGVISGITRGTTSAHLARATLEGIAYQIYDLVRALCHDCGQELTSFKVDGGATANNLLMQFQSDILQMEIVRPNVIETTALGAAFLAGLSTDVWKSPEEIGNVWTPDRIFSPAMNQEHRQRCLDLWARAIEITHTTSSHSRS